jgi:hypothetical protein
MNLLMQFDICRMIRICVLFILWLSIGVETQPQSQPQQQQQQTGNLLLLNHTIVTLSEARNRLASTSSGELVFFAGGKNATGQTSDRE